MSFTPKGSDNLARRNAPGVHGEVPVLTAAPCCWHSVIMWPTPLKGRWTWLTMLPLVMQMAEWNLSASHLLIDFDSKFTKSFDAVFAADGTKVKRVGPLGPNLNAYAERWVLSLRQECLDHLVICGERHLRFVLKEYLEHYNVERPHQSKGNVPLPEADREPSTVPFPSGEIECRERLGGLLRHYHRTAA